jgi:lysozyme
MQVSLFGIELIKAFEGFYARPYKCPAGVWTQGYGHTAAAGPPEIGGVWSESRASDILAKTVADRYAAPVEKLLTRKPTQAQFDAMVSFAYNVGVANFRRSSVLRLFNAGEMRGAAISFHAWNKAAGRVLPGLTRRRASEALVFAGVKDLDFDGRRDPGEPIYGAMAQAVDPPEAPQMRQEPEETRAAPTPPATPLPRQPDDPGPRAAPARPGWWSRIKTLVGKA